MITMQELSEQASVQTPDYNSILVQAKETIIELFHSDDEDERYKIIDYVDLLGSFNMDQDTFMTFIKEIIMYNHNGTYLNDYVGQADFAFNRLSQRTQYKFIPVDLTEEKRKQFETENFQYLKHETTPIRTYVTYDYKGENNSGIFVLEISKTTAGVYAYYKVISKTNESEPLGPKSEFVGFIKKIKKVINQV